MRRHRLAVLALLLAGCGTTVPTAQQVGDPAQVGGAEPGLSQPGGVPAPAPGAADPGVPGGPVQGAPAVPQPSGAPRPSSAARPTVVDRSPVTVGILTTNNDAAAGAGVDNGNSFTPRRAFEAAVAGWNARGGLAGRRITPVYEEIASSSSSFSSDLERICASFVQDHRVSLVLSVTGAYVEDFGACLARAGIPWLAGDYALGDTQSLQANPTLVASGTLTTDERANLLLRRLAGTGRLGKGSRLGVVVEGCPFNERTYTRTVQPVARQLGVTLADKVSTRCFLGIGDLSGLAAELQGAVLRFQSSRVTDVVFVSGAMEGNLVLFFMTAASGQQYRPRYGLTSAASPAVQERNTPRDQLANAVGLGWLPAMDDSHAPTALPTQRACSALLVSRGLRPSTATDRSFAFSVCDTLSLADALLRRSRGRAPGLAGVAAELGTAFRTASTYDGQASFAQGRRSGPATGRLFAWSPGCACFGYTGPAFSLVP